MRFRLPFLAAIALVPLCAFAQDELTTDKQIADKIRSLAAEGKSTASEQTRLVWLLMMRSNQGDKDAHNLGKAAAQRLSAEDDLNYRAKFAFGYFRTKEAFDSRDPITRKRRIDEGRRAMTSALPVGARDADFQFDAGMALVGFEPGLELYTDGLNALTLARRLMGDGWASVPKDRQADWHVSMAAGFLHAGLVELARDAFTAAYQISPDSPSGRKAIVWLRSHGGG